MLATTWRGGKGPAARMPRPSDREQYETWYAYCLFVRPNFRNNLGTLAPKHQGKRGSRADEKAGRINNIDVPALSAKPRPLMACGNPAGPRRRTVKQGNPGMALRS